jgi:hypothetical protein
MYEYGTMTPDDVILRRGRGRGRMMEGMNQPQTLQAFVEMSQLKPRTTTIY